MDINTNAPVITRAEILISPIRTIWDIQTNDADNPAHPPDRT